jgi:hypothetical protein
MYFTYEIWRSTMMGTNITVTSTANVEAALSPKTSACLPIDTASHLRIRNPLV